MIADNMHADNAVVKPQPDHDEQPLLAVQGISKTFHSERAVGALADVSFQVADGEIVCLVGPSGSGKSTLLRIIAGLVDPDRGDVQVDGVSVRGPHPAIGMVFQRTNLMPWRNVADNVLLPVEVAQGGVNDNDRQAADRLLRLVGLEGFERVYPKQLSGGMAQRVVLARALMQSPRLLLLDEPFGSLDAMTRERMNVELLQLNAVQRQTLVIVTHSISEAVFLADRVIVMSQRPGRIVAETAVDLPRPRTLDLMGGAAFGHLTTRVRRQLGQLTAE